MLPNGPCPDAHSSLYSSSQSQPRIKALNLACTEVLLVIIKQWQAMTGGHWSKAARPGLSLSTETQNVSQEVNTSHHGQNNSTSRGNH